MYKSPPLRDQNRCACPAPLPKLLPRSGCECGRLLQGGGGVPMSDLQRPALVCWLRGGGEGGGGGALGVSEVGCCGEFTRTLFLSTKEPAYICMRFGSSVYC